MVAQPALVFQIDALIKSGSIEYLRQAIEQQLVFLLGHALLVFGRLFLHQVELVLHLGHGFQQLLFALEMGLVLGQ